MSEIDVMNGIKTVLKADSALRSWASTIGDSRLTIELGNTVDVPTSFPNIQVGYVPEETSTPLLNQRTEITQAFGLMLQLGSDGSYLAEKNMITFKEHVRRILDANFTLNSTVFNSRIEEVDWNTEESDGSDEILILLETEREAT